MTPIPILAEMFVLQVPLAVLVAFLASLVLGGVALVYFLSRKPKDR